MKKVYIVVEIEAGSLFTINHIASTFDNLSNANQEKKKLSEFFKNRIFKIVKMNMNECYNFMGWER